MRSVTMIIILQVMSGMSIAQTQSVRGKVTDLDSGYPIIGAHVVLLDSNPIKGAITDLEGQYHLQNVPLGRISLKFSSIGYKDVVLVEQLLERGKELFLNIQLEEEIESMNEIVIMAKRDQSTLNNEDAMVAARSFDVQETKRYAGSRNDIARMASNYAGVANADDARNDIVIRGNSPSNLLWRLEGIDIPNPNHFNAFGTTGGPVSILNNNNLANSDFFSSAYPADYGNTVSGVFDLELRKGNGFKREYMGQLGFNGLEFGAEGPFSKNSTTSYMVNYRYSTLGIFKALGVQFGTGTAVPEYQDLTFSIDLPTKKTGSFKLFGIGGRSNIHFESATENDENGSLYTTADLKNNASVGVIGLRHFLFINPQVNISTTLAASSQFNTVEIDSVHNNSYSAYDEDIRTNRNLDKYSIHTSLNTKLSSRSKLTFGIMLDNMHSNFQDSLLTSSGDWFTFSDSRDNTWLTQLYGSYQWKITESVKIVAGLHYINLQLNNSQALEPRMGISFSSGQNGTISLGYGLHSQMQPINVYGFKFRSAPTETNRDLGFTRSHQFSAEYKRSLGASLSLNIATYYQWIFDAPVETDPSSYSMLNYGTSYGNTIKPNLVNNGAGENYGLELTLEKYFSGSYYFLVTTSLFRSFYQGSDEVWRNTAFNTKHIVNLLGGKEFQIGESGVLAIDLKLTTSGGRYTTPIDLDASRLAGEAIYIDEEAFSDRYENYFRTDFKIGYRLNMKKVTQEWLIDIQNLFNKKNIYEIYYNPQTENLDTQYQLGILIVPQWRILF